MRKSVGGNTPKLTPEQVKAIQAEYKGPGQRPYMRELAAKYGVSAPTIHQVVRGEYRRRGMIDG